MIQLGTTKENITPPQDVPGRENNKINRSSRLLHSFYPVAGRRKNPVTELSLFLRLFAPILALLRLCCLLGLSLALPEIRRKGAEWLVFLPTNQTSLDSGTLLFLIGTIGATLRAFVILAICACGSTALMSPFNPLIWDCLRNRLQQAPQACIWRRSILSSRLALPAPHFSNEVLASSVHGQISWFHSGLEAASSQALFVEPARCTCHSTWPSSWMVKGWTWQKLLPSGPGLLHGNQSRHLVNSIQLDLLLLDLQGLAPYQEHCWMGFEGLPTPGGSLLLLQGDITLPFNMQVLPA